MKSSAFFIFFSIVLSIYALVNYYIYIRGLQCTIPNSSARLFYKISFLFIASSYIISRFLERLMINHLTNTLTWIGSFWLAAMLYFLLFIILLDILRLINYFIPFFPSFIPANYQKSKFIICIIISSVVAILLIIGYFNTINSRIVKLNLVINKKAGNLNSLNLVMVSDIHLGTTINKNRAKYLVDKINSLNPDIIIFAGDILDEDLQPVIKYNIGDILKKLYAPLGIFAITGNHEYIGGIHKAEKYITDHNISLLKDSAVLVNNSFWLAGRDDRDKPRFTGINRKNLSALLKDIDKTLPVILLDHQPFNLDSAAQNGVDLQLSGHTHHAQLWPLNYLTRKIYELDWGYLKKDNTHFYVSCGFGSWGPPARIASRSEIVNINIRFK